jgi:hypothetical protein
VDRQAGADERSFVDGVGVLRGAIAGLVVIVPVTVVRALVSHRVHDFDHSAWAIPFFFLILLAYGVAGWVAGRSMPTAPLSNGALAGLGSVVLWLPLRVIIWAIRNDHRGLFTGADPVMTVGQIFGALVLAAGFGILGALLAARRARSAERRSLA